MRITKQMLIKSNDDKKVIIFILVVICFIFGIALSGQIVNLNKNSDLILENQKTIIENTNKIEGILNLTEEENGN